MWWVHGNEKTWVWVIEFFTNSWRIPDSGEVVFIIANEQAIIDNIRYIDKDLNRCFGKEDGSLWNEQNIAKILATYIQQADYLVDIHNTTNPISEPFLICEHDSLFNLFDVDKSISWLDKLHPGWSDGYGNSIWCKSVCLEAWSIYDDQLTSILWCESQVVNFLRWVGNIDWTPRLYTPDRYNFMLQYATKTDFTPLEAIKDFQEFKKWEYIWTDWEKEILAPFDGICIFAYKKNSPWEEWFVYGTRVN